MSLRSLIQLSFCLLLCTFFLNVRSAFAATLSLSTGPATLGEGEEYNSTVSFSISAQDNTVYYLRGVFYKSGSTNYCGFTWNGNDWYSGPYSSNDSWKNFLPITIVNNSWTGTVKAKIDQQDSGCKDSGSYSFKIERFTQSGSGSFDTQNEQTVSITLPTQTPTPQPPTQTPKPLPTSTRTPTPISTKAQTMPTGSSKVVAEAIPTTRQAATSTYGSSSEAVLGDSTVSSGDSLFNTENASQTPTIANSPRKKILIKSATSPLFPILFILVLPLLLIGCGILFSLRIRKKHA